MNNNGNELGKPKFHYIESFDSLRGIAALFVLLFHGSYGFFKGGWIGVDLFFALSGYLITSLLLNEYSTTGNISFSKFYVRRVLRLFPPLIICVLLSNILWSFTNLPPGTNRVLATTGALFYFTNLLSGDISGNMAHLWSLSVEEHFYFLWPLLTFLFVFKISYRKRVIFLIILFIIVTMFRIFISNHEAFLSNSVFTVNSNRFTFCKIDGIILGSLLAFIPSYKSDYLTGIINKKSTSTLLIIFLLFIFIAILFTLNEQNMFWRHGGFIFTNLLCSFTVFVAIKNSYHYLLSNKILRWFGKRSYGIYVYHFPIFLAFERLRQHDDLSNLLLVTSLRFIVSFTFAALSYKYIEQPILRFKKQYEVQKITSEN